MPSKRGRVQVSLIINNEGKPAQLRKAEQYFDRTYTKALVRKGNTIETLLYYTLDGRVYVKNGEKDITIVEATTGQTRTSSAEKRDFVKHDPDLKKTGNSWTCGGRKLRRELKEILAPKNPVPQVLTIGSKRGRRIVFEEDSAGVIREVFDDGDCIAVEAERAAAKKRKLFDHPLLVIPC
ncbi:hypothetical protein ACEPAF_549 [Sanghuangporus sanghuang]|uniref:Uncharacterized protein n=1 Tax=Sanghuangporus baumii TaxID=108892 RepID=A0A9Q5HUN1_SANBA|nr:hypothetical protein A7U60_g6636 [Sanghuangporus baumii]